MQEVVRLRLTITKLVIASTRRETIRLTFVGWILYNIHETVPTDHLLLSNEAVRVIDTSE
jgi:hypothetical protein